MLQNKRAYIETLVLFVLVMVTKYLFDATLYLGNTYLGDSAIFTMVGQAWSDGFIPYRDLFDHKGPILFLFYAISAWIQSGIVGIMIVTAINLTIALRLILSISRVLLPNQSNKIHYLVVILSLIFFRLTHECAGISEEFSLVFILLPLLLCVKHLTKVTGGGGKLFNQHPYSYSFLYGACFAAIAMIRINNAPMNVGIVLGFLILMLKGKYYKELLYNALYCLLGFLAVILPIIAYFSYHDALYEMIYATFIFNWNYRATDATWFEKSIVQNLLWLISCFYLVIVSILRDRKYGSIYSYFFIPASIICIFALLDGFTMIHYFVNALPYFVLSVIFTSELFVVTRLKYLLLTAFLLLIPYYKKGVAPNIKTAYYNIIERDKRAIIDNSTNDEYLEMISIIPSNEHNQVYSFNATGSLPHLIKYKIYPIGKYFIYNNHHSKYDKKVAQEQDEFHRMTKVKWILTSFNKDSQECGDTFTKLLKSYDLINTAGSTNLYRRKESADETYVNPID